MSNWPLLQFIENLEGFDFVALLLGAVVSFFRSVLLSTILLAVTAWAPTGARFYAMLGAYAGLCIRDWWLQPYSGYDPYLTAIVIAGGLLITVVTTSAVAKR